MVDRCKCAFLRKDGRCVLHHAQCSCNPLTLKCPDGVRRSHAHPNMDTWHFSDEYDKHTARGRFAFATRNVSRKTVYGQCTKKERYATEYRAREVARKRQRSCGVELRVYHCHFCNGYHLTHKTDGLNKDVAA